MARSSTRVLVVDDFEPFRRFLTAMLQEKPEMQVIGEVSDGLEAVQKSEELRPDLIVLDIGLPTLNGIEAARRIRQLSPESKILFVSQESSAEVVEEAFRSGAWGYVVKSEAGGELLAAVNAVLRGEKFVGGRLAGYDFSGVSDAPALASLPRNKVVPLPQQPAMKTTVRHEAGFYSSDQCFLDDLAHFVGSALKTGNGAILFVTESHRDQLLPRLQTQGLDIGAAIEQGRYVALDASDALSTFMIKDMPDPARFLGVLGDLIVTAAKAATGEARVAVFGECVHLLWARGNAEAAIQVEKLANQLARTYDVDILCGYSLGGLRGGLDDHIFQRICAEHSAVHSR